MPTVPLYEIGGYVWERASARFRDAATGRWVPRTRIMDLIQERIEYHQGEMGRLTQALVDQRLTLAQWERAFAQQLKDLHLQQAALARGGWQNMTQADFGRVGRALRDQYGYLHRFASDIATRDLTPGQIAWRAGLYAMSGRQSYWNAAMTTAEQAGWTKERRIAVGDKGTCTKCDGYARMGWQPIGTLPAPGGDSCAGYSACRCEKEYR